MIKHFIQNRAVKITAIIAFIVVGTTIGYGIKQSLANVEIGARTDNSGFKKTLVGSIITSLLDDDIGDVDLQGADLSNVGDLTASTATFSTTTFTAIASSTKLGLGDGTASLPSLYFSDDTDSGIYRIGANNYGFSTNGTLRMNLSNTSLITYASTMNIGNVTPLSTLTMSDAGTIFSSNMEVVNILVAKRFASTPPTSAKVIVGGTGLTVANTQRITTIVGSGGAVTVTATPSIADMANGEIITLVGTSDTNTVTWQDESALASSGLQLAGGVSFTMGLYDTLTLVYTSASDKWSEIGRANN